MIILLLLVVLFACALYTLRKEQEQTVRKARPAGKSSDEPKAKPKGPRKPPQWVYVGGIIDNVHKTATAFFHDFANDEDREVGMTYVDYLMSDGMEKSALALCNRWNLEEAEALREQEGAEPGNQPGTK